jgi:pimeloyl-ACP methyl ester carboxylesterase
VQADQAAAGMGNLASEVDRAALTGEFADYLARCFRKAVSTGIAGWRDDDLAFVTGWGFDLASVRTPAPVWHGAEDRMVPDSRGRWLADRLPDCRPHLEPADGHLSLIRKRFDGIVSELTARLSWP